MKIMFISLVTLIATSMLAFAQTQTVQAQTQTAQTQASAPTQAPAQPTTPTVTVTNLAQTTSVAPAAPAAAMAAPAVTAAPAPAPVAPAAAPEIVKQPTTVVEAAPLSVSHAEELRRSREATEVETEQKIVEKLEQSRIDSEKKRQNKVLDSMTDKEEKKEEVAVAPVPPVPAPVPVPALAPVPVQAAPAPVAVAAPVEETTATAKDVTPVDDQPQNRYFTSLGIGMMNYNNSPDLKNFGDFMLSVGKEMGTNFTLSADLGYNSLNQTLPAVYYGPYQYRTVNQYTLGMTARYVFPIGKFKPNVGLAVDYVRRAYGNVQYATWSGSGQNTGLYSSNSNALDYGLVAGADYQMSEHMSIGADFRYMMNATYEYDNASVMNLGLATGSALETRNYSTYMAALKYSY